MYKLHLRYVYTFYSFDELLDSEVKDELIEIGDGCRFKLWLQEDSSFIVSGVKEDFRGKYVVLTYPNKDNVVIHQGACEEIRYDEYFDSMGDDNHNVYEGFVTLNLIE
jgi:hypothetical protein